MQGFLNQRAEDRFKTANEEQAQRVATMLLLSRTIEPLKKMKDDAVLPSRRSRYKILPIDPHGSPLPIAQTTRRSSTLS